MIPFLPSLLAEWAQPVHRTAAQAAPLPDEVKIAITVGASMLLALIGVVFYLGRKVGAFGAQVKSFEDATREATRLGEKWNSDLLAALREVDERLSDALSRIVELEHKWRSAKDMPERLRELEEWRREVDVRCEERHRLYGSQRVVAEEAAPVDHLFEASKREREDDK